MGAINTLADFGPTMVVSLTLGYLTYRAQKAGQRDTREMQSKANSLAESKQAAEEWRNLYFEEKARRLDAEQQLRRKGSNEHS